MPDDLTDIVARTHPAEIHAVPTMTVTGRLDALRARELRPALQALVTDRPAEVCVDLDGVTFVDSSGLAVLVQTYKTLRSYGGRLVVVRPASDAAMRIFHLTQFDQVFTMAGPRAGA